MEHLISKTGTDITKIISDILEMLYLRLANQDGNQDVICGEILALNKLLLKLGYHAELKIEIKEGKN